MLVFSVSLPTRPVGSRPDAAKYYDGVERGGGGEEDTAQNSPLIYY